MVLIFALVAVPAALALGFVLGRVWEIRREIRRNYFRQGRPIPGAKSMAGSTPTNP
jgi:hypothetical protein